MEGTASVAGDVLASYAADAAQEVAGVAGLVEGRLPRQGGVRISVDGGGVTVELHLVLGREAAAQEVGAEVQRRVADYLERMAGSRPTAVDVMIEEVA
jgi:uncharacterized alkaline shock family protein YloU